MRLEASTIEELFAAAGEREADLRAVDAVITAAAPDLERRLFSGPSITMIGYGEMTWERKTRSGVWPVIGMTAQKNHIALYVAAERDGETLADHYRHSLGRTDNGKNCIRFRRVDDIDLEILAEAIHDAVAWAETQETRFGRDCARPV